MEFIGSVDLVFLVQTVGLLGVLAVVFAESGLFIGFFLPGDSLLFTAGFLASQGYFNIWFLAGGSFIAAVLGDSFGYAFGNKVGPAIFRREGSLVFNPKNLERSRKFYERYGSKTIVLARFMPIVRTFAPILAGVGKMRYRVFLTYNLIGGFLWAVGLSVLGFYLGRLIPRADRFILAVVAGIIFLSILPPVLHYLFRRR